MRVDALFRLIVAIFIASLPLLLTIKRSRQRQRAKDRADRSVPDAQHDDAANRETESPRRSEGKDERPRKQDTAPSRRSRGILGGVASLFRGMVANLESALGAEPDDDLREPIADEQRKRLKPRSKRTATHATTPGPFKHTAHGGKTRVPSPLDKEKSQEQPAAGYSRGTTRGRRTGTNRAAPGTAALSRVENLPALQKAIVYQEILGPPRGLKAFGRDEYEG